MTPSHLKSTLLCLLTVTLAVLPVSVRAAETSTTAPTKKAVKEASPKEPRKLAFSGKLKSVDKPARTIVVGKRTFHVPVEALITKGDRPATLDDGVAGEEVGGSYLKGDEGKLTVVKLRFGPKPAVAKKPAKSDAKKESLKKD